MKQNPDSAQLEHLLEFLREARGFDFTGYKRSSLARRVQRRMTDARVDSYEHYKEYLETHPDEFPMLFDTVLINVTSFFRDSEGWEVLAKEVLPAILEAKSPNDPVRAWVVGCATGEEAYTLAMVMAEVMGSEAFQRRAKIYASDADQTALAAARLGSYRPAVMKDIPPDMRQKYFEASPNRETFRPEFRRQIVFGALDLVRDAPISRVDLITCRNTLMYFNAELQARIIARFHFALNDPGFLFLGKAEMLIRQNEHFTPANLKHRIFRKIPRNDIHDRAFILAQTARSQSDVGPGSGVSELRDAALEADPYAQVLVTVDGRMALINDRARDMFGLMETDRGRLFQEIELSYRPVELRSVLQEVQTTKKPRMVHEVERAFPDGTMQYLDVSANPVSDHSGNVMGVVLTFLDVTENRRLRSDLERSKQDLETAYEELESTNEELETTNEELQSTVEELETTNEELQSTNEELQTMNEELQSSNEELHTINIEIQERGDFLLETSALLDSMLRSFKMGVAILDRELNVKAWNEAAEELWGLRSDDVLGQPLLEQDIGLPLDPLVPALRRSLERGAEQEIQDVRATNRRGRSIVCRIRTTPLLGPDRAPAGVVLLMEETRTE